MGYNSYSNWIPNREIVKNIEDCDLLFLEGGGDVGSEMYGEKQSRYLSPDRRRDKIEKELYLKALELGKPVWGTCRGLQLIGAMNGCKMVQHQPGQGYIHGMKTYDGKELAMSSMHHNAIVPYVLPEKDYKILSWTEGLSSFHWDAEDKEILSNGEVEVEACYFPKTRSIGVQGHPECLYPEPQFNDTIEWCRELLFKVLNNEEI